MSEATAVRRVEEVTEAKPPKTVSLLDQMEGTFHALTRRAYEIFDRDGRTFGRDLEHWLQAEKELLHPVPVNIRETDDAFEVSAEVPGFSEKEVEIGLDGRRLTIAGRHEATREEKKGKTIRTESSSSQLLRVVDLPAEVEAEKASASLKNGILLLTLPKSAKSKAIRIHPKTA